MMPLFEMDDAAGNEIVGEILGSINGLKQGSRRFRDELSVALFGTCDMKQIETDPCFMYKQEINGGKKETLLLSINVDDGLCSYSHISLWESRLKTVENGSEIKYDVEQGEHPESGAVVEQGEHPESGAVAGDKQAETATIMCDEQPEVGTVVYITTSGERIVDETSTEASGETGGAPGEETQTERYGIPSGGGRERRSKKTGGGRVRRSKKDVCFAESPEEATDTRTKPPEGVLGVRTARRELEVEQPPRGVT